MALIYQAEFNGLTTVAQVFKYANNEGFVVQCFGTDSSMTEHVFKTEQEATVFAQEFTSASE